MHDPSPNREVFMHMTNPDENTTHVNYAGQLNQQWFSFNSNNLDGIVPVKDTFKIPSSASSLPAANVAPPAKKLEWWNIPFFFWNAWTRGVKHSKLKKFYQDCEKRSSVCWNLTSPAYSFLKVLTTNIHLAPCDPLLVSRSSPVCWWIIFPLSTLYS